MQCFASPQRLATVADLSRITMPSMEASLLTDSSKQTKTERKETSSREDGAASVPDGQQADGEADVGRIESFRLEEAFLAACKDGNLPVVRFCLENRCGQFLEAHLFSQVKVSRLTRTAFHCLSGGNS